MVDSMIEVRGSQDKPRAFIVPGKKVLTKTKQGGGVSKGHESQMKSFYSKI